MLQAEVLYIQEVLCKSKAQIAGDTLLNIKIVSYIMQFFSTKRWIMPLKSSNMTS